MKGVVLTASRETSYTEHSSKYNPFNYFIQFNFIKSIYTHIVITFPESILTVCSIN